MSRIIKITKGEFVMTKGGLVSFSAKIEAYQDEPEFNSKIEIPVGTVLQYDVEEKFKELGLNYLDYFGYSFSFNIGVDVYAEFDGSTIKPITTGEYKNFNEFVLFAVSNADGDKIEFTPISDWRTKPVAPAVDTSRIVRIVYDPGKHKLRGLANDGKHGEAWTQFPTHLRIEGAVYEVDYLDYDYDRGFYRAKGTPRRIS